jgi:hypothetical protein
VTTKNQRIQWVLRATPAAATEHVLVAAQALKFKANAAGNQVLMESPLSFRTNTYAGKYTGVVLADGEGSVVVWALEGLGSNQPRNLHKLAEKLPAGILAYAGPVIRNVPGAPVDEGDARYRTKHGITEDAVLAIGVGGYCAFDGQFLTIHHVGALGRMTVGKGVKRVPLVSVSAVQMKPAGPVVSGFIQFTLPGSNERRSEFGKQTFDAAGDENSVVFTRDQEPAFLALRSAVEEAIAARHMPIAPTPTAAAAPSVLDQIGQLASLRDAGVLTDAEFHAKKVELLSRL